MAAVITANAGGGTASKALAEANTTSKKEAPNHPEKYKTLSNGSGMSNSVKLEDKREAQKIRRYEEMFKKQAEMEAKKLRRRE